VKSKLQEGSTFTIVLPSSPEPTRGAADPLELD
jgi:hypothetical protein